MNETNQPLLMNAEEVAAILRIQAKHIRRTLGALRQKGLPAIVISREYYYPRQGVIDFINNCGAKPEQK